MLISTILICLISIGGLALTYLVAEDETFMWRLAVGNIVGSAIFGVVGFVLAMVAGLNPATAGIALAITILPAAIFAKTNYGSAFKHDWNKAKGKLQGGNLKRFSGFGYYLLLFVVFWFFFGQAMYETSQGIFTGGSNNLGDLPFHLGAIFSFTDGNNFPPQNPSFAGAKFSYPFIADLLTACFMKLGADVKNAMFMQDVAWAFSLAVIFERFTVKLTGSKLAGRIAPWLLILCGGLGFIGFFSDFWAQGKGIWDFIWTLPRDYTISDTYRFGNSLVVLFITQRSLLLGMPLTIVVLGYLWKVFESVKEEQESSEKGHRSAEQPHFFTFSRFHSSTLATLAVGLLAGTLPLIHLHSLAVLFVVTGFLFILAPEKWRIWVTFGCGVAIVAIPELIWSITGTASETSKFIGWHFGWDHHDDNIIWFWVKNTGLVIPLAAAGCYLIFAKTETRAASVHAKHPIPNGKALLLFYMPFVFIFFVANAVKLAPWEWDNIKVLIYWFLGSIPFVAYAIAWLWAENTGLKIAAAGAFVVLTMAGGLDVWRTATGQNKINVFDADAVKVAEIIKQKTQPNALFLNAPTYNSAVVLTGRRSFMRYIGHLSSHGIDYAGREDEVKRIYSGGGVSDLLLRKNEIEYVVVSPIERTELGAKDEQFMKYPVIAESGQYRVYKIK